jgi:hypothetical protein
VPLNCLQCGGVITVKKRAAKYCSAECYTLAMPSIPRAPRNPVTRQCSWCGESVTRPASDFHGEKAFCDVGCMAEWQSEFATGENHPRWRGGSSSARYGMNWRPMRRRVLERSGGLCEGCGKLPVDEVHHRIPIRCFARPADANTESNLIALCKKCHRKAHKALRATLLDELFFMPHDPAPKGFLG